MQIKQKEKYMKGNYLKYNYLKLNPTQRNKDRSPEQENVVQSSNHCSVGSYYQERKIPVLQPTKDLLNSKILHIYVYLFDYVSLSKSFMLIVIFERIN